MLQKNSYVIPADRCGVFWVSIFHLYNGSNRKFAYVGNFVKISVKLTQPNNWVLKKSKYKAIVVRTKAKSIKKDGSWIKFYQNNAVLLKKRTTPLGGEIYGPTLSVINRKLFIQSFSKII